MQRSLNDSKVEGISADLRFVATFTAALTAATIALRACGYRTVTQVGHHTKIIGSLQLTIDADPKLIQKLKVFSNKRNTAATLAEGKTRYGVECAACHGMDGRGLTDNGRWMYPRAADLTSAEVQAYSDVELFWIVKNGIRLSGMPAFGRVETNERIWHLVHYARSLQGAQSR